MLKRVRTDSPRRVDDAGRLLRFIEQYQQAAAELVGALRSALGLDDLLRAWHEGRIPQAATFAATGGIGRYQFHGVGCRIETPGRTIDVEFGPGSRVDGFDVWRLHRFATENSELAAPFTDLQELERAFEQLSKSGKIVRPESEPSPHLYYLAT